MVSLRDINNLPRMEAFSSAKEGTSRDSFPHEFSQERRRKLYTRLSHYRIEDSTGVSYSHKKPMLATLTPKQFEQARCTIQLDESGEARLYDSRGLPLNCQKSSLVINENDEIFIAPKLPDDEDVATSPIEGREGFAIQHSTLASTSEGRPVKYAGKLSVENGKIKVLSMVSGHYCTGTPALALMTQKLSSVLKEDVKFELVLNGPKVTRDEMLQVAREDVARLSYAQLKSESGDEEKTTEDVTIEEVELPTTPRLRPAPFDFHETEA